MDPALYTQFETLIGASDVVKEIEKSLQHSRGKAIEAARAIVPHYASGTVTIVDVAGRKVLVEGGVNVTVLPPGADIEYADIPKADDNPPRDLSIRPDGTPRLLLTEADAAADLAGTPRPDNPTA